MIPVKIIRKTKATAAAPTAAAAQNIDTGLLLPRTLFDDLFQKVLITPPVIDDDGNVTTPARYAIQANYDLYSIGGISGYRHSGKPAGGTAAGIDIEQILTDGTPVAAINGVTIYAPPPAAGASSWAELTGKPAWLTDTQPTVSVFQNDAGYITAAALAGYPTTNQVATLIDNTEQTLKDWVNAKNYATTTDITDTEQTIKDWVKAKNYATQSYVDAAKVTGYAADMDTVGQDIRLIDEEGNIIKAVIAPYAQYTEGIGKPYGDFSGLRSYYWSKNDNSGYPTYLLISKVCAASEWSSWGNGHPMYGISGTVHGRRVGNMNGTGTWHVNAAVSYSTDYIKTETSDATYMQPCVVTYGGNVYVALRLLGSGYDMMILGSGYNLLDSPIQVNCTDLSGTCPSVSVIRDYSGANLTATSLSAASLTATYDITTTNGNLSVAGNATVQGETYLNGSVYLPDAFTFFGTSGIYVHANRPGEKYGDAAFIGVHQGYAGTDTVATVNLDGTVRLWHCLAINQDPDADASLRVGGLSKLDYLTLGGITRPDGYWLAAPSGYFGNPSSGTYTSFGDGGIELSHATTPYIDFHYKASTADYTSRLIASEDGVLMLTSTTADPALRIGNAYLRYDTANKALYVTGRDGAQVNLCATGGIAAYSGLGSGITQLANLSLTGRLTAASVKANRYTIGEENFLYENSSGQLEFSLYDSLGFGGSSTYFNSDGWLFVESGNEIILKDKAALRIGADTADHGITDLYADGSYVYITVNGKRYRLTPSATTTV